MVIAQATLKNQRFLDYYFDIMCNLALDCLKHNPCLVVLLHNLDRLGVGFGYDTFHKIMTRLKPTPKVYFSSSSHQQWYIAHFSKFYYILKGFNSKS